MNVKKAKALRKSLGYHPTDERAYRALEFKTHGSRRATVVQGTRINGESTPRGQYRAAKKGANVS